MADIPQISMIPSTVESYQAPAIAKINPSQKIQSKLEAGKRFAELDPDVIQEFFDFTQAANDNMLAFQGTAREGAKHYMGADTLSALTIDGVLPK